MGLGGNLEGSRICSGGLSPLGRLLERSWRALGPKKRSPRRPWTALKKVPREVSALLGPKGLPKVRPNEVQNAVQKRFRLKMLKSENPHTVHRICLIFKVPGAHFGYKNWVQNGVQNGISMLMALESLLRTSWSALGALRSRKKEVGSGSWAPKRANMSQHSRIRGVRPGQHWERKAHCLAIERSG